jgi:ESS family glutamate:Na+ symporter
MPSALPLAAVSVCVLLATGLALRATLRPLRVLHIPASVVAGVLGLLVVQFFGRLPACARFVAPVVTELAAWPGPLIAVVFAGLLLERPSGKSFGEALRRGSRSGILAWIIILGQIAIGLVVYLLAVRPDHPGVPASFGQLLEVSWAGGHGSSAAMAAVYDALGFPQGRDLAFFLATVGLVYGVCSGLVWVNLAVRRGWTRGGAGGLPTVTGLEPRFNPPAVAFGRTSPSVIEPLAAQAAVLGIAFGVGLALQKAFIAAAGLALGPGDPARPGAAIDFVGNIPLFLFTLLGGWCVRRAMSAMDIDDLIDGPSTARLSGLAMEALIVAAISTMRLDALRAFAVPIALLVVLAAAWTSVCLLALAPRLLPREYWFELGLLNYGFATANTPQGLMLLRIIDPELASGAAEDYAVAAPLSAPFVGGGVLTIAVLPLLLQRVPAWWVIAAAVALIVVLYAVGRRLGA